MKTPREPIRFLTHQEMEIIHRNACHILAEVGMKVDHDEALDYLQAAGCKIDRDKKQVKFPEDVVQKYVNKMQHDFKTRDYPKGMAVRYSHVRFKRGEFKIHPDFTVNAGGYCRFIYDLNGVRREATLQDVRHALKLVAQLEQITYTGLPVAAQDIPLPIRQIVMTSELVKHTSKLGGIEVFNKFDIEYICRIGEVVRGSLEELRKRPILIGYLEVRSPLVLDRNVCDVVIEYVKRKFPQSLDTMPNAGITAPIHPAGALALGIAETLGGLILAYSVDENACVTIDLTPSFSDMNTMIFKYAGAERVSLLGARIQMISEWYGCPSGVHGGKTDSCIPGMRCGVEKGISMLMPVLCGAIGFGTIGHIENALTFSPLQLILDNEIVRYVRRAVMGFKVADEAINVNLIKKVGIGGSYLSEMDTAIHFREFAGNLSPFFKAESWGSSPRVDDAKRWEEMGQAKARKLLTNDIESPLSKNQIKEIDKIVEEAAVKLKVERK